MEVSFCFEIQIDLVDFLGVLWPSLIVITTIKKTKNKTTPFHRLDELRHRLIPLYTYDPTEDQEWGNEEDGNEDEELNVSKRNKALMAIIALLINVNYYLKLNDLFLCICQEPLYKEGKLLLSTAYGT